MCLLCTLPQKMKGMIGAAAVSRLHFKSTFHNVSSLVGFSRSPMICVFIQYSSSYFRYLLPRQGTVTYNCKLVIWSTGEWVMCPPE